MPNTFPGTGTEAKPSPFRSLYPNEHKEYLFVPTVVQLKAKASWYASRPK